MDRATDPRSTRRRDGRSRVAVVHEWLVTYAGSERVLEQILELYPEADLYALIDRMPERERGFLRGRPVRTSFLQRLPFVGRSYKACLPLMPLAVEQFDLSGYDLIITSAHAVAKGVLTGPGQLHVCYCHSPIRYAWDLQHQYLKESRSGRGIRGWLARLLLHYMRIWDVRTSTNVDLFLANSAYIARRIRKAYGRSAEVVHPPVDVDAFTPGGASGDFFLTASRMVPYKRVPLLAEAFSRMPDKKLVVVGDGTELQRVREFSGPNVEVLGAVSFEELRDLMRRARAFLFAAEEDFGILPVEAQACGTPVIAYGRGGATETVVDEITGVLFSEQTVEGIIDAVSRFEAIEADFNPGHIRLHAEGFRPAVFRRRFVEALERAWERNPPLGAGSCPRPAGVELPASAPGPGVSAHRGESDPPQAAPEPDLQAVL